MKRFTPPRKLGSESESEYSDSSDYSDSEDYSNSSSYTSSYTSSDSESGEEDETLQAIRVRSPDHGNQTPHVVQNLSLCFQNTARAQKLRAKFEEWEKTQDAKDQMRQMMIHDENGASLETASNLKARFEALHMAEGEVAAAEQKPKFRPKRFKVGVIMTVILGESHPLSSFLFSSEENPGESMETGRVISMATCLKGGRTCELINY